MKIFLATIVILLHSANCLAQLNMEDSTISVIGYWDKNETQTYTVTNEKYKVKNGDTTSREIIKYEVDILIRDSTAKTYTIVWKYKNLDIASENPVMEKLLSLNNNLDIIIKTDEMGSFLEVVNWKEMRAFIKEALALLSKEYKDTPKMKEITQQVEKMFSSKEAIEAIAIKDILQMYIFHGARYKLQEVLSGKQQIANLFGGPPFDADYELEFAEIDSANEAGVLRYVNWVNKEQVAAQTYEYLKKTAKTTGSKPPEKSDIPELAIEDRTAASIHGPSGWVLYSYYIRQIEADSMISIETREIELK